MLRCKEFTELVTDHLEGHLPLARSVRVSFHLGSCQHCRAYHGQMKSLVKLLRQLPIDRARRESATRSCFPSAG